MEVPMCDVASTREADVPIHVLEQLRLAGQGVRIARFAGFDSQGRFLVRLGPGEPPVAALSTIGLGAQEVEAQVAVTVQEEEPRRPVILGLLYEARSAVQARIDGERVCLEAKRQLELRCGDASIVLTAAGKVLIRGNYVLTRARGANRIKGAFVDIN